MRMLLTSLFVAVMVYAPLAAQAGSPHFVTCTESQDGGLLSADGKEAGLGDEPQIHVVLSAEAQCINPGDHHPQAGNKESVTASGSFPVQNGKALFSLDAAATFQPPCSPPMSVVFTSVSVCDDTDPANVYCCTL